MTSGLASPPCTMYPPFMAPSLEVEGRLGMPCLDSASTDGLTLPVGFSPLAFSTAACTEASQAACESLMRQQQGKENSIQIQNLPCLRSLLRQTSCVVATHRVFNMEQTVVLACATARAEHKHSMLARPTIASHQHPPVPRQAYGTNKANIVHPCSTA